MMLTANTILSAERLTKKYGRVVALDDVSFLISEGITGILGENGAGKSPLGRQEIAVSVGKPRQALARPVSRAYFVPQSTPHSPSAMLLLALTIAAGGVLLDRYAEADTHLAA